MPVAVARETLNEWAATSRLGHRPVTVQFVQDENVVHIACLSRGALRPSYRTSGSRDNAYSNSCPHPHRRRAILLAPTPCVHLL